MWNAREGRMSGSRHGSSPSRLKFVPGVDPPPEERIAVGNSFVVPRELLEPRPDAVVAPRRLLDAAGGIALIAIRLEGVLEAADEVTWDVAVARIGECKGDANLELLDGLDEGFPEALERAPGHFAEVQGEDLLVLAEDVEEGGHAVVVEVRAVHVQHEDTLEAARRRGRCASEDVRELRRIEVPLVEDREVPRVAQLWQALELGEVPVGGESFPHAHWDLEGICLAHQLRAAPRHLPRAVAGEPDPGAHRALLRLLSRRAEQRLQDVPRHVHRLRRYRVMARELHHPAVGSKEPHHRHFLYSGQLASGHTPRCRVPSHRL
mmetsp:Transcript_8575/g.26829  ORF Transcript_8575/g.26829 Transcript_8575/m.26829 type:complete len:321 (+) Transcript_8575:240-1202(+)